jgi:hypothetical protein
MSEISKRFWMVYGEGQRAPAFKHYDRASAERECQRLARQNPGITFFALCAVSESRRVDVETRSLPWTPEDDGLPF